MYILYVQNVTYMYNCTCTYSTFKTLHIQLCTCMYMYTPFAQYNYVLYIIELSNEVRQVQSANIQPLINIIHGQLT